MWKRIVSAVLLLLVLGVGPVLLSGCEDGDDIQTHRTETYKDIPAGDPQPKVE